MKEKHLAGKLYFFSEQGMEGGQLAIIDHKSIKLASPTFGLQNGRAVVDKNSITRKGVSSNSEMLVNGSWVQLKGDIPAPDLVRVDVLWNDGVLEKSRLSNTLLIEQWGYDGLIFLENEDLIKVFEPLSNVSICEGLVNEIPLKTFSSTVDGHFTEQSLNWKKFFTERYDAELFRAKATNANNT